VAGERVLVVDDSATIRRVVEGALTMAGYETLLAPDGAEGLAIVQQKQPDLILLDFVMPKMNGYQFCQVLRGIANLKDTPVVLLSAKADKIGEQFVRQKFVVDVVSKPFAPEALVAVVEHVLAKARAETGAGAVVVEDADLPLEMEDDDPASRAAAERAGAARRMAERIADRAIEALGDEVPVGRADEVRKRMIERLSADVLSDLATEIRRLEPGRSGDAVLTGELGRVSMGEVMQLLELQKQTGTLEMQQGAIEIAIGFREGLIDLAQSRGGRHEFLLGRYLLEEDLVSKSDLDLLLKNRAGSKRLLGDQLVKLGYITADDLKRSLSRQTAEVVYEALRWHEGTFRFLHDARRPEAEAARLGLPVATILLEGFRRVDEWRLMERVVGDFDAVFAKDEHALDEKPELAREEALVLDFVNGNRSVREIIEKTHMSSFEVCRVLYTLVHARIIRRRSAAAA
jgi:CheY-like chemotaxis protein